MRVCVCVRCVCAREREMLRVVCYVYVMRAFVVKDFSELWIQGVGIIYFSIKFLNNQNLQLSICNHFIF